MTKVPATPGKKKTNSQTIRPDRLPRRANSSGRIVDEIIEGIRVGRYVPGQKLVEADLTHGFNVSRGPVREALNRLAAGGIVKLSPHRGAYIRALSRHEAKETLIVIEVLTGLAARLAAETVRRGGHAETMLEAFEQLSVYGDERTGHAHEIENHQHFYETLYEIGGNLQLASIMPTTRILLLRAQTQPYLTVEARKVQLGGYKEVTEAVLAGNPGPAERAMRKHIRRTMKRYDQLPDAVFASDLNPGG